jgi:predicted Fe-Mo cluster-binding NifX family protein
MTDLLIAVPSNKPGGLDSGTSAHFGHCDFFTLVNIKKGKISDIYILPNLPHEQGGCLAPVNYLSQNSVKALIAGGMGMRPLVGFQSAGIDVYHNNGLRKVLDVVTAFVDGKLQKFGTENTCGGGSHGGENHGGGCGGH